MIARCTVEPVARGLAPRPNNHAYNSANSASTAPEAPLTATTDIIPYLDYPAVSAGAGL